MKFTKKLAELLKNDALIAGGKGASLGEMLNANIPVPDGYVVTADTFDQFIAETDLTQELQAILSTVDIKAIHTVEFASEKIQAMIQSVTMPEDIATEVMSQFKELNTEYVAVRSSATAEDGADHAWAGQLDSYLNTTEEDLLEMVQSCWASLFTPRAIFYRFEKGLHTTHISVAVVIQKMVNSEKSGIAFSVHPVNEDHNQIIIEAGLGLGEAIVSGSVTPDSYVITKEPQKIIDVNVNTQNKALYRTVTKTEHGFNEWKDLSESEANEQVLSGEQTLELSNIIVTIENHYGFPCDIEWAFENDTFYIVQSRPITTLRTAPKQNRSKFKKENYLLAFWVEGISVFVTDLHLKPYKRLGALFVIDEGMFKQYFNKKDFELSLDEGLAFYSSKNKFNEYKKGIEILCSEIISFYEKELFGKKEIEQKTLIQFFSYASRLCDSYSRMNFEFTDKAFQHQEENSDIKENLKTVSVLKDEIRTIMNMILFEESGYCNYVFNTLSLQFNIQRNLIDSMTQSEIIGLFDGKKYDKDKIQSRNKAFAMHNDEKIIYEGKDVFNIIQEFKSVTKATKVIEGLGANGGTTSGRVKIISVDYNDLNGINAEIYGMKQGDILVAQTTAPELMMACKKASAIITDMGGLLSHAAIVSRELGIPCVIGTENATQILKDGDFVEVDANSGIIKIIKKKEEFFDKQISLTEWLGNMDHKDSSKHRNEDNEKRERLAVLNEIIDLPFDRPVQFSLIDVVNRSEKFQEYLDSSGDEKCALRLIPLEKELKKLRMRGKTVREVTEGWLTEQDIDPSKYRADYVSHADETTWSTIFIINEKGIRGEVIADTHEKLTQGYYDENKPISFEYDFENWKLVPENKEAQKHLEIVIEYLRVPKDKQYEITQKLDGTFSFDYLDGYFETKDTNQGLFFIDYNRLINQQIPDLKETQESSILSGQIASAGIYSGKVCIVDDPLSSSFTDGDILVCDMTSPKYLPLMQKAGAIVTNRGGVTCHAAIVARELGIPCIIGTENATEILKDGDFIEVDANEGCIKIIKT